MRRKSPFPGMDPYLEQYWGDVHHSLIQYTRDSLQEHLPESLLARAEERVFVEQDEARLRSIITDAHIKEVSPVREWESATDTGVAVAEPRILELESEEVTEGFIEIRERDGGRVVTIIEYLSPTNKAGGVGTTSYLKTQEEVLHSECNLVEIDLVRAGSRVFSLPSHLIPEDWHDHYLACIRRADRPNQIELYSLDMRLPLPNLAIPLRAGERPVALQLQPILDQCYRLGRYDTIDYTRPLDPPLSAELATWIRDRLPSATAK